jgi:hypothetical protein
MAYPTGLEKFELETHQLTRVMYAVEVLTFSVGPELYLFRIGERERNDLDAPSFKRF